MLSPFATEVLNELYRLSEAVQQAAQELESKDARIADLEEKLAAALRPESP